MATTETKKPRRRAAGAKKRASKAKGEKNTEGGAHGSPRALWTGSIGFGLLQIPVSLHTATANNELRFNQLDDRSLQPVGYKRVNKATGEEVPWEHIVRGYEVEKGEYVVITDEDLKAADVEATQSIDIVDFVDRSEIQPVWLETPYYLAPLKRAERPYALFREALVRTGKVAIGKVVIRTRQHLAMVYPEGRALVCEILRWNHEVRPTRSLELPEEDLGKLKVSDRELEMAEELIERMSDEWDPARYQDEYRDRVVSMIEAKAKSGEVKEVGKRSERQAPVKTSDLVTLLRKSLESGAAGNGTHKAAHKKKSRAA